MSQYRPMMAGHPPTQKMKNEEQEGLATTLLHIAALEGEVRKLEHLLQQGAFVDAPDQELKTALHLAVQYGQEACASVLLRAGADSEARSSLGETPLMTAALSGQFEMSKTLLKLGVDLELADHKSRTALHLAAVEGHCQIIEGLLRAGAQINAQDEYGCTPLYAAVKAGRPSAAQLLLSWKADPLVQTAYKDSALHQAVRQGQAQLVPSMAQHVAPAKLDELRDSQQNNALHIAASVGRETDAAVQVMHTLLDAQMAVNASGMLGWTPLHCAVRSKNFILARLLLQHGASAEHRASDGRSIAELVAKGKGRPGYEDLARLLL